MCLDTPQLNLGILLDVYFHCTPRIIAERLPRRRGRPGAAADPAGGTRADGAAETPHLVNLPQIWPRTTAAPVPSSTGRARGMPEAPPRPDAAAAARQRV